METGGSCSVSGWFYGVAGASARADVFVVLLECVCSGEARCCVGLVAKKANKETAALQGLARGELVGHSAKRMGLGKGRSPPARSAGKLSTYEYNKIN